MKTLNTTKEKQNDPTHFSLFADCEDDQSDFFQKTIQSLTNQIFPAWQFINLQKYGIKRCFAFDQCAHSSITNQLDHNL